MPGKDLTHWNWDLPDDWAPATTWCVTLTIPGDEQYLAALMGAVGLLTIQKNWARDSTRTGAKTVAALWDAVTFDAPPIIVENCEVVPTPPIPDEATAKDWGAAIIQLFFQHVVETLNTCAAGPGDCDGCVATLMSELSPYGASDAVEGALNMLCQSITAKTPTERAEYEADCVYLDEFNAVSAKIADNAFDWLNKLSSWLFDWLMQTSDEIMQALNLAAGFLGGPQLSNWVNDHGGPGGGAGFGSTCPWTYTIDPTNILDEFTTQDFPTGTPPWLGTYAGAGGWEGTQTANSDNNDLHGAWIYRTFPFTFHITSVEMHFDLTKGSCFPGLTDAIAVVLSGVTQGVTSHEASTQADGTDITYTVMFSGEIDSIYAIVTDAYFVHGGGPAGSCAITKFVIHGTGANPFV